MDDEHFDGEILIHINSVLMVLNQVGLGPDSGFTADANSKWDEFFGSQQVQAAKSYVYLKVRLLFDPPTNSFTITAMQDSAKELEWRLRIQAEGVENV